MNEFRTQRQAATLVGALAFAVMAVARKGAAAMIYPILRRDGLIARGLRPSSAHNPTLERSSSWMPTPVS
jgi:hypothetical protein